MMKNITLLKLEKHKDSFRYEKIDDGIYKDLNDLDTTNYRIALSFELEENETFQYPLEDILDKYFLHISNIIKNETEQEHDKDNISIEIELAGELEDVQNVKKISGKRAYNRISSKENEQHSVSLVIE